MKNPEAASKINEVALRIKLSEVQRLLQENEKILSSNLTPIKALFINLFVNVGLFALLSGLAVGLLHYLSNEPFVTQTAWGQTFLQCARTAAIGSNLILLLVSTTKSIIRTLITV